MDRQVTEMFVVISVMKQVKVVTKNDNGHWGSLHEHLDRIDRSTTTTNPFAYVHAENFNPLTPNVAIRVQL